MRVFSEQIAWQNYFATQVVAADAEETEAEAAVKTAEALFMLNHTDTKLYDARDQRSADEEIGALKLAYRTARARRKLLVTLMENRERSANLVSRELTRRVGREGVQRRSDKWTP